MHWIAYAFVIYLSPILALGLALLGWTTAGSNPAGWLLLLIGLGYAGGFIYAALARPGRFRELGGRRDFVQGERADLSFWAITLPMIAVFFLSPGEYLLLGREESAGWAETSGIVILLLGLGLFIRARRSLGRNFSGHAGIKIGQDLVTTGPYRHIRHPAYAGYLLMAIGISLSFQSLVGGFSVLSFLVPGVVYRIRVEERMLEAHFGKEWCSYAARVPVIFPVRWIFLSYC